MRKNIFVSLVLAATLAVGIAQTSQALETETILQSVVSRVEGEVQSATDTATERRQEIETKRQEIEQKVAEKKAAIAEKLSGKRAERCAQRQDTINRVLDTRTSAAQQHFAKFKAIQDKLQAFVTDKDLNVENASALELIMNDKQANAQAAIDAVGATDFDCASADATAPGAIVMDQIAAAKQALKDYRAAIKDYAVAIRSAAISDDSSSNESESRTETETGETAQ